MLRFHIATRRVVAVGYMLLIFALSLKPVWQDHPDSWIREMLHNLMHVPAYALMAFFVYLAWSGEGQRRWGSVLIPFIYGVLLEVLQGFVPGRYPSWLDIVLNALGIITAVWLVQRFKLDGHFQTHA